MLADDGDNEGLGAAAGGEVLAGDGDNDGGGAAAGGEALAGDGDNEGGGAAGLRLGPLFSLFSSSAFLFLPIALAAFEEDEVVAADSTGDTSNEDLCDVISFLYKKLSISCSIGVSILSLNAPISSLSAKNLLIFDVAS